MTLFAAFQNVPPASVTADKLMTNFLHLDQLSAFARLRRLIRIEDIVIVMDGSGSVRRCDFDIAKEALKNMMGLATGSQKYAAVTFSSSASVNFKFLPHSTAKNEVMKIPYPGGMTNTQAGLVEAKKLFDDPSSGNCLKCANYHENISMNIGRKSLVLLTVSEIKLNFGQFIHKASPLVIRGVSTC